MIPSIPRSKIGAKTETARRVGVYPGMAKITRIAWLATIAHIPLGLILYRAPTIGIVHPIAVFAIGIYFAVNKRYAYEWVALTAAYIVGAEVLWRMARVPIYWEFGKYGVVAIMVVSLMVRPRIKLPILPVVFGLLLIPACFVTFGTVDLSTARALISFNMSGPLALVVASLFFANVKLSVAKLRSLFIVAMIPIISVAVVTMFFTITLEEITFTTESNFATSGGFGPNQVSSILGLGVFLAVGCLILFTNSRALTIALTVVTLLFAAQSMMTFSRGGIYNAVAGLTALLLFRLKNVSEGLKRAVPVLVVAAFFILLVFPYLNSFTGGKLEERFNETDTTNRTDIVFSDFEIFLVNPLLGVGVGIANEYRARFTGYSAASHTELSRLISEHGSFGVLALIILIFSGYQNVLRDRSLIHRAVVAGFAAWCLVYMLNSGMRLVAPSVLWGLTFATIVPNTVRRYLIIKNRGVSRSTKVA